MPGVLIEYWYQTPISLLHHFSSSFIILKTIFSRIYFIVIIKLISLLSLGQTPRSKCRPWYQTLHGRLFSDWQRTQGLFMIQHAKSLLCVICGLTTCHKDNAPCIVVALFATQAAKRLRWLLLFESATTEGALLLPCLQRKAANSCAESCCLCLQQQSARLWWRCANNDVCQTTKTGTTARVEWISIVN